MIDKPTATAACACGHPLIEHYANGCGWCICKVAGTATEDADQVTTTAAVLPTYAEVLDALNGTTDALSRLLGAVRGLFASASTQDGYAAAVDELKAAHDAAIEWCACEAKRYRVAGITPDSARTVRRD